MFMTHQLNLNSYASNQNNLFYPLNKKAGCGGQGRGVISESYESKSDEIFSKI